MNRNAGLWHGLFPVLFPPPRRAGGRRSCLPIYRIMIPNPRQIEFPFIRVHSRILSPHARFVDTRAFTV